MADWSALTGPTLPPSAAYLSQTPVALDSDAEAIYKRRLTYLMPILASKNGVRPVLGCALSIAPFISGNAEHAVLRIPTADRALLAMVQEIFRYARDIGPPPPATPLEHYNWFQASACYLSIAPLWPARSAWEPTGLKLGKSTPSMFEALTEMATDLKGGTLHFDPLNHVLW